MRQVRLAILLWCELGNSYEHVSFWQTHVFSSTNSDPTSAWSQIATVDGCQYDSGAMLDDDGSVYVSFKNLTDSTHQ